MTDKIRIAVDATRNHIGKSSIALIVADALRKHGFEVELLTNDAEQMVGLVTEEWISDKAVSLQELFKEHEISLEVTDFDSVIKR